MKYRTLSKDDVCLYLEGKVKRMCDVFSLSRNEAVILLHHSKWSIEKAEEEWLACEDKVRKAVGLYKTPVFEKPDAKEITCQVCNEEHPRDKMLAVSCGHPLCGRCWTEHINETISSGDACLTLQCPVMSCDAAVGLEMIELVSSQEDKTKYHNCLLKSCIAGSRMARWCPAEGCEYAVFSCNSGDTNESTCRCSQSFCWNCLKEAHAPVNCAAVGEWSSEIIVQSGNWVLANTRPCPNCRRPIEKNTCLLYAKCTICDYTFQGNDVDASSANNDAVASTEYDDLEPFHLGTASAVDNDYVRAYNKDYVRAYDNNDVSERAKNSLERYQQYYEGWLKNESGRANAARDLQKLLQGKQLEILCEIWDQNPEDLQCLEEAHLQVVECRRILKWTYVYGYFLLEAEHPKKNFCEFLQEQAINLVSMLEKQVDSLQNMLTDGLTQAKFEESRQKLIQLTRVLRHYFERMVDALKCGLPEVCPVTTHPVPSLGEEGSSRKACPSKTTSSEECSYDSPISSPAHKHMKTEGDEYDSSSTVSRKPDGLSKMLGSNPIHEDFSCFESKLEAKAEGTPKSRLKVE